MKKKFVRTSTVLGILALLCAVGGVGMLGMNYIGNASADANSESSDSGATGSSAGEEGFAPQKDTDMKEIDGATTDGSSGNRDRLKSMDYEKKFKKKFENDLKKEDKGTSYPGLGF